MNGNKPQENSKDIDPQSALEETEDEATLPEIEEEPDLTRTGTLAAGRSAIVRAAKHAPKGPGVYRMIDGKGDVLYVGKAKSIRKRVVSYARQGAHDSRITKPATCGLADSVSAPATP